MPALRDLIAKRFEAQAADESRRHGLLDPAIVVKEPGSQSARLLLELVRRVEGDLPSPRRARRRRLLLDAYRHGQAQSEGALLWTPMIGLAQLARRGLALQDRRGRASLRAARPEAPALVHYEALRERPVRELERIAKVLELDVTGDDLGVVVAESGSRASPSHIPGRSRDPRRAARRPAPQPARRRARSPRARARPEADRAGYEAKAPGVAARSGGPARPGRPPCR